MTSNIRPTWSILPLGPSVWARDSLASYWLRGLRAADRLRRGQTPSLPGRGDGPID
jgi:hypothetical protein